VLEAQAARAAVVEQVAPTVVAIFGPEGGGGGSGVLISADGYAVTNFHVTNGCGDAMKCGLNDGRVYDAVIVGTDPVGDVALIKMLGRDDFPFAAFADSDEVRPGDWCLAMGNPFLLAQADFAPTVTYGLVSGTHRYQEPAGTFLEYTDCLQIDASVNPGNSGGPLFAADGPDAGKLIGINGRISIKRGRVNSGAAYAISSNQVKYFLGHLRSGRALDHGTLNATVRTTYEGDVLFDRVLDGSAAQVRGVREGDELVAFAGRPIRSVNQFKNVLGVYPAGWALPLTVRRNGETLDLLVRTRGLNQKSDLLKTVKAKPGPPPNDAVKPLLEKRPGYANAYFNVLERDRVLESLGEPAPRGGWRLRGEDADGLAAEFTIADRGVGLKIGDNQQTFLQRLGEDAVLTGDPPGTGGLLFALRQWQLLRSGRTDDFADLFYVGTEPLDWDGPTVEVLAAEDRGVTTHFYVQIDDEGRGTLLGLDSWRTNRGAACEIRFSGEPLSGPPEIPSQMDVASAGTPYRSFTFTSAATDTSAAPSEEAE
jgi:S1-C subfamily serine protease